MTLAIPLSAEAEARLKDRARLLGLDPAACAERLLEEKLKEPESVVQISGELHERFLDSGMSEQQLADRLEQEKHAARAARHRRQRRRGRGLGDGQAAGMA